jgi:hypothetical protein
MPIPKPRKDESKKDFMQRCMIDDTMTFEYEDIDQRLAICSTSYEENLTKHESKNGKSR